jgi:8-oxo-dGTP pyrophosphatase MutT (NUDIX family)
MSEIHSASVAILLENMNSRIHSFLAGGLILVQKRLTGLIGLPAGHLEKEDHLSAIHRELREETGLTDQDVKIYGVPDVIVLPGDKKTSIGIVFRGKTLHPISAEGYESQSPEISFVKPFSIDEILKLIANPELLYRPDFNWGLLNKIVIGFINLKYAYDSPEFRAAVARSWGVDERFIK